MALSNTETITDASSVNPFTLDAANTPAILGLRDKISAAMDDANPVKADARSRLAEIQALVAQAGSADLKGKLSGAAVQIERLLNTPFPSRADLDIALNAAQQAAEEFHATDGQGYSAVSGGMVRPAGGRVPSQQDLWNSQYVSNGNVTNINGFAEQWGFDREVLNNVSSVFGGARDAELLAGYGVAGNLDRNINIALQDPDLTPKDAVAILGAALGRNPTPQQLRALDKALEKASKIAGLSDEEKAKIDQLRQWAKEGKIPEATAMGLDDLIKNLKNIKLGQKLDAVIEVIDRGISEKRMLEAAPYALKTFMSGDALRILQDNGFDINASPDEIAKSLKSIAQANPNNDSIAKAVNSASQTLQGLSGMHNYVRAIRAIDAEIRDPKQRELLFYSKSTDEKMEILKSVFEKQHNRKLSAEEIKSMTHMVENFGTAEQAGHLLRVQAEAAKLPVEQRISYMIQETEKRMEADLRKDTSPEGIKKLNDYLRVKQEVLKDPNDSTKAQHAVQLAFGQIINTGRVNYAETADELRIYRRPLVIDDIASAEDIAAKQAEQKQSLSSAYSLYRSNPSLYAGAKEGTPEHKVLQNAQEAMVQIELSRMSGGNSFGEVQYYDAAEAAVKARIAADAARATAPTSSLTSPAPSANANSTNQQSSTAGMAAALAASRGAIDPAAVSSIVLAEAPKAEVKTTDDTKTVDEKAKEAAVGAKKEGVEGGKETNAASKQTVGQKVAASTGRGATA